MPDAANELAMERTRHLVKYLSFITEQAQRRPLRDIRADGSDNRRHRPLLWLDGRDKGWQDDDVIFSIDPPRRPAMPTPPSALDGWVDATGLHDADGDGPVLAHRSAPTLKYDVTRQAADLDESDGRAGAITSPPPAVLREYYRYQRQWRRWSDEFRAAEEQEQTYRLLEDAVTQIMQRDDERELVLGVGLVRGVAPDGTRLFRHLVTERLSATIEQSTARIGSCSLGQPTSTPTARASCASGSSAVQRATWAPRR